MHIPDGYLGPETIAAGWAVTVPIWYRANRRTRQLLSQPKMIPVLAFGAAFAFLVMMLNVPVAGGTTAHAVGAVLIAVVAGPEVACLAVSAALVIQAFFFGDGGILTLGVNCLNMAIVMPYVGYSRVSAAGRRQRPAVVAAPVRRRPGRLLRPGGGRPSERRRARRPAPCCTPRTASPSTPLTV